MILHRCDFVRLPQVKDMTCLSKSSIYRLMADGGFPSQISLGAHSVVWVHAEIEEWCSQKISQYQQLVTTYKPSETLSCAVSLHQFARLLFLR